MGYNGPLPQVVKAGGTGDSSLTAYAVLCGGTTTTGAVQSIASVGTSPQVLTSNGPSALPTFQAVSASGAITTINGNSGSVTPSAGAVTINGGTTGITTSGSGSTLSLTGTLIVANGGTGSASFTAYGPVVAASTSTGALTSVTPSATSGVPLISGGSAANPSFGTAVVAGGGTGNTSTTAYALVAGGTTTTGAFQSIANGAATSTVLIGNGTSVLPSFSATPQLTALGIGATAGASGLTFDGSNLLTNYTLGTFTPTKIGASTAGSTTYSNQTGQYIRIGSMVNVSGVIAGSAATGTGNILYGGLPFTVTGSTSKGSVSFVTAQTWPAGVTSMAIQSIGGAATCSPQGSGTAVGAAVVQMANAAFNEQYSLTYLL